MKSSLTIRAGAGALRLLQTEGLTSDKVSTIAGAAGGPKWLALSQLDRVLFGRWLKPRNTPLFLVGSSIGSWRFAAVSRQDPLKGIDAFETAYLNQRYSPKPSPTEVTQVSQGVMDGFLEDQHVHEALNHPYFRLNVITIRCKNVFASERRSALLTGLALAAAGNAVHPSLLKNFFERVVFSDKRDRAPFLRAPGFESVQLPLDKSNLKKAVLASGSIPGVMKGISDLPGHEGSVFRDGGILDYHLNLPYEGFEESKNVVLFPHFSQKVVPNWFDKGLPWRKPSAKNFNSVVLISPSREFISSLPLGKIPDRKDFALFKDRDSDRHKYWRAVISECKRMADELQAILENGTIAEKVQPLFH